MTYSCSDFADDLFEELHRVGAIHENEAQDEEVQDNPGRQAQYALAGIARFVDVHAALLNYRQALADFATRKGVSLQDGRIREADKRAEKALAAIHVRQSEH